MTEWTDTERAEVLGDFRSALRGYPNEKTLRAGLRAIWAVRRSAQRHRPDAAYRRYLYGGVRHYTTLLRALKARAGGWPMIGFTPILSLRRLRALAEAQSHGTWLLRERVDGPRIYREAIRSFPESVYGVDLFLPGAGDLASRWPTVDGEPRPLPAREVVRLLEET